MRSILLIFFSVIFLSGCNVAKHTTSKRGSIIEGKGHGRVDDGYVFSAPCAETWNAILGSVMEFSTIEKMDKKRGILVTETITIDGDKLGKGRVDHSGKTYSFFFQIELKPKQNKTEVTVEVRPISELASAHEENTIEPGLIDNSLRLSLFRDICTRLFPKGDDQCSKDFPVPEVTDKKIVQKVDKRFKQEVLEAQRSLRARGYDPGPADGILGERTKVALKLFQKNNQLIVSGLLDQATLIKLNIK